MVFAHNKVKSFKGFVPILAMYHLVIWQRICLDMTYFVLILSLCREITCYVMHLNDLNNDPNLC